MNVLLKHTIEDYTTVSGVHFDQVNTSYQIFGQALHTAPVILVNHALTGNSDLISEEKGWWKDLIGADKLMDTNSYTIIAFNIPGNGYDGELIDNYKAFSTRDIAAIFHTVLQAIKVEEVYAIIGGSLGGGIAWEMACLFPSFAKYIIPIATDWKSSDWLIGHNTVQESILLNSKKPLEDARKMAMLFYRTPTSFTKKFNRTKTADNSMYNVQSWLQHHGNKINSRFDIKAYLMMNHLLTSINVVPEGKTIQELLQDVKSVIIQISIDSDLLFIPEENLKTKELLDALQIENQHHQIKSIDGHDAFLIEHEQLTDFLSPIFKK